VKVLGLDVAMHLGWAAIGGKDEYATGVMFYKPAPKQPMGRLRLYEEAIAKLIDTHKSELAVIEGYGFAHRYAFISMVELGTTVRSVLYDYALPYIEIAPNSLKKFVTGHAPT